MNDKRSFLRNIKSWFTVNEDNLVKSTKLFLPLIVAIWLFQSIPSFVRKQSINSYDTEILASVESIEIRTGIHETQIGGKLVMKDFKIEYIYEVNKTKYSNTEIIELKNLSIESINYLRNVNKGDLIKVKYDPKHPKFSMLHLN